MLVRGEAGSPAHRKRAMHRAAAFVALAMLCCRQVVHQPLGLVRFTPSPDGAALKATRFAHASLLPHQRLDVDGDGEDELVAELDGSGEHGKSELVLVDGDGSQRRLFDGVHDVRAIQWDPADRRLWILSEQADDGVQFLRRLDCRQPGEPVCRPELTLEVGPYGSGLALADVDGDARDDLLLTRAFDVLVIRGVDEAGAHRLLRHVETETPLPDSHFAIGGDLDRDDRGDLVIAAGHGTRVFYGDGESSVVEHASEEFADEIVDVQLGFATGDELPDILVNRLFTGPLVLVNQGDHMFAVTNPLAGSDPAEAELSYALFGRAHGRDRLIVWKRDGRVSQPEFLNGAWSARDLPHDADRIGFYTPTIAADLDGDGSDEFLVTTLNPFFGCFE